MLVLCALCGICSGCVNLKPKADTVKLYALGPSQFSPASPESGPAIYVARPDLPPYLDGKRIQYRHANGEVRSVPAVRWAEPLQEGVSRALAEFLGEASRRPSGGFYPWPKSSRDGMELRVHFHQFGATAAGDIQMTASWELREAGATVRSGLYQSEGIAWNPEKVESLVAGINQAMHQFATEITETL